jgi:hypothetical protein
VVRPIFADVGDGAATPSTTPEELAAAIREVIAAGARVINLSAALARPSPRTYDELEGALDHAAGRGVLVVAAAGNQGMLGSTAITRHPWVIPVVACDDRCRPLRESNLGNSIGSNGLRAPGEAIQSLGTDGGSLAMDGTSVAAPFVTGTIALLWSVFPRATAEQVRRAVTLTAGVRRSCVVPPLLDAVAAYRQLAISFPQENHTMPRSEVRNDIATQPHTEELGPGILPASDGPGLVPRSSSGTCGCGGGGNGGGAEAAPRSFIYALGRIEPRFPNLALEKEFAQAVGRMETKGMTDRQAFAAALSRRENRYLAREVCWVFTVEGMETYLLLPRDPGDFDLLLAALRSAPRQTDVDVVIGTRGPLATASACGGIVVPFVVFDQLYSFDVDSLVNAIPRPEKIPPEKFAPIAEELFGRIQLMADNAGATDEHRTLNYLAVRYPAIYEHTSEMFGRNFSLAAVDVRPSQLGGARKVVDVVFSYRHRETDGTDKVFVRVDITEKYPFLVSKLSPYYAI